MAHIHRFNSQGKQLCCSLEERINRDSERLSGNNTSQASDQLSDSNRERNDDEGRHRSKDENSIFRLYLPSIVSLSLLLLLLGMDQVLSPFWIEHPLRIGGYVFAYLPVGFPVFLEALKNIRQGELFTEFFLMSIATAGAFFIGAYAEGVAVMLFYAIGEVFQTLAITRAKTDIKSLLDQRPDQVTILKNCKAFTLKAELVNIGDIIQLRAGEKLGLDGELLSETATFNTAALTGESKPDTKKQGQIVLAGMINTNTPAEVKVTAAYSDSKLSHILEMVQNASANKAPTELFIRKFAKIYTPVVVALAIAISVVPYFFVAPYEFNEWFYRSLVFLVISCPCALVISIPLGYFGGIGAASKNGILVKGSNFLDVLASIKNVVTDKTGTMTEGVFQVQSIEINPEFNSEEILQMVNALERHSTHPIATAINEFVGGIDTSIELKHVEEIPGHGLIAEVNGSQLLVGNTRLLNKYGIKFEVDSSHSADAVVVIALGKRFLGYLAIADRIKQDAPIAVSMLKDMGVNVIMLSGDKNSVVQEVAKKLGIDKAFGDLLPEDKTNRVMEIRNRHESVAFVGDGVNDAPAVALCDVGIAMGGLGSDTTISTADVVIQDDNPCKIPKAITIGKQTKRIVLQNISLAFGVKMFVLILGAGGIATLWEAVFADVGVALLAIMNAVRIRNMS